MLTVVVYQENISQDDLDDYLQAYPSCRSPLHNKDIYEKGEKKGQFKKAHWHIIFQCNMTPKDQRDFNRFVGLADRFKWEEIEDGEGIYNYLTHDTEDSKDKCKYSKEDIWESDSFDLEKCLAYKKHKKQESHIAEIIDIIQTNDLWEYAEFIDYMISLGNEELLDYSFKHEMKFKHYIDSKRWSRQTDQIQKLQNACLETKRDTERLLEVIQYMSEAMSSTEKETIFRLTNKALDREKK